MTVTINQNKRDVLIIKEQPKMVLHITEKKNDLIKIKAQGPIGPRGEGIDDNTDFVMYYNLAKG